MDQPPAAGAHGLTAGAPPLPAAELAADPVVAELLGRCWFPPAGTAVTCAVSGGADSTALLTLAVAAGCRATAVHVDHGLRPGSEREAEVVAGTAARLGAAFVSHRVEVGVGSNQEARARGARYRVLPPDCLLGHTLDDQAETMLGQLLRGAGLDGIAAMRPDARRPLLRIRRAETEALCRRFALDTVDDPSNHDPAHRRNRIRHEVLPLLDDVADRDVAPLLARSADIARWALDHLRAEAALIDPTDAAMVASAPPAVARHAIREWLRAADPERHPPNLATVERVLRVARGRDKATDTGGGGRVVRSRGRLRFVPPPGSPGTRPPAGG